MGPTCVPWVHNSEMHSSWLSDGHRKIRPQFPTAGTKLDCELPMNCLPFFLCFPSFQSPSPIPWGHFPNYLHTSPCLWLYFLEWILAKTSSEKDDFWFWNSNILCSVGKELWHRAPPLSTLMSGQFKPKYRVCLIWGFAKTEMYFMKAQNMRKRSRGRILYFWSSYYVPIMCYTYLYITVT